MLVRLADALATTVDYLLIGHPAEDTPLGDARLFRRFQAVEGLDNEDREAVIKLIDAMIAKQQVAHAIKPVA